MAGREQIRLLLVALLGSIGAYLMESVHRHAGVWRLSAEASFPWWIPVVYFVGLYGVGRAFYAIESRRSNRLLMSPKSVLLEGVLLVSLVAAPPLFHSHEMLLLLGTMGYLSVRLLFFRRPGDVAVVALVIIVDLVVESLLLAASLFQYSNAQWLPLPLWLAPLWGGMAFGLRRLFTLVHSPAADKSTLVPH